MPSVSRLDWTAIRIVESGYKRTFLGKSACIASPKREDVTSIEFLFSDTLPRFRLASEIVTSRRVLCELCLKETLEAGSPFSASGPFLAFLNVPEAIKDVIHAQELNEWAPSALQIFMAQQCALGMSDKIRADRESINHIHEKALAWPGNCELERIWSFWLLHLCKYLPISSSLQTSSYRAVCKKLVLKIFCFVLCASNVSSGHCHRASMGSRVRLLLNIPAEQTVPDLIKAQKGRCAGCRNDISALKQAKVSFSCIHATLCFTGAGDSHCSDLHAKQMPGC